MSDKNRPNRAETALSRRDFMKSASATAAVAASQLPLSNYAFAASASDKLRVGLVGCGGRGTGAAGDCVNSAPNIELVAMGDLFKDRLDDAKNKLKGGLGDKFKVTDDRCFTGFDNYKQVIDSGIDLVILATPQGFRPLHFDASVRSGKHFFMEKTVAVDPTGVRMVIAASELAAQKKLGVVAGTQRRHQNSYIETIKRIHDGALGEILSGRAYWNQGGLWSHARKPEYSDMEWQVRNWLYFSWLSGDHIVEQHVHNLDVINWALNAVPVSCVGMGGRQSRTEPVYGNIYDHFSIDYEYPNGVHVMSMCRQIHNTASNVSERVVGTKGSSNPDGSIRGENSFRFRGDNPNPYVKEHTDLIMSIRYGTPLNEGKQIAHSTLTAIMGRMSAYTGKQVSWEEALNSKLDLVPDTFAFGPHEVEGVAVPGRTPFV